jgi:uncharacterized protein (DUF4415 family)
MGKIFPAYDYAIHLQPAEASGSEPSQPSKQCGRCKDTKPLSEFNKSRAAVDGLQWECRSCSSKSKRQHYHTKECSACGERKFRSEFYKCSNARDGLQARCKPCDKEALQTLNPVRASKLKAKAPQAPQPKRGRGRPRKAPDEHKQTKNVTVDADLVGELQRAADILEKRFGFRPTHSQTMRWLVHNTTKEKE